MREKVTIQNANQSEPIRPHVLIDRDWALNVRAEYVKDIVKQGWLACEPTSRLDNYQAMELMPLAQVVSRACDLADELFNQLEARGWVMPVPFYAEIVEQLRDGAPAGVGFKPPGENG
jgi:hypothetical protein